MTATKDTFVSYITRKFLRGIAVIIMLTLYGASLVGITAATSVATSTEASAWHGGRHHRRGRRGRRGRYGRGRRGRRGRYGRGRRGWYPGFQLWIR